ncbi:MAG: mucoidy inhibitor MuiA family protein [Flavobacteriia bacterium]|nr:mucoidy inhibitor MuiA family protein [Flavobacteriia bacterium]
MKNLFIISALFASMLATSQIEVNTSIDHVTVYREGAVVVRTADVNLTNGTNVIQLKDLPNGLQSNTIQFDVANGIRIIKFDYRYLTPEEVDLFDLTDLGAQVVAIEEKITAERDLQVSLAEDLEFIRSNADLGDFGSTQNLQATDEYMQQRRRELRSAIRESERRLEALQVEGQKVRGEMALRESEMGQPESIIELEVASDRARTTAIQFSYLSKTAKWTPYYNVRATGMNDPLTFEMIGQIVQNSGEDWEDVTLHLSTGNPNLSAVEPELPVWRLGGGNYYVPSGQTESSGIDVPRHGSFQGFVTDSKTGKPLPFARVELKQGDETRILVSDEKGEVRMDNLPTGSYSLLANNAGYRDLNVSITVSNTPNLTRIKMGSSLESMNSSIEVITGGTPAQYGDAHGRAGDRRDILQNYRRGYGDFQGGNSWQTYFVPRYQPTTTLYTINEKYSVASDGRPIDVIVNQQSREAELFARIRPALSENAYIIARMTEWESLNLQKANMLFYVDGAYLGARFVDPSFTTDTLSLALGVDPEISFRRERINAMTSTRTFARSTFERFQYEIVVRNTRPDAIEVVVEDQRPISNHEEVGVRDLSAEGAEMNPDTGIITWRRQLPPNEEWKMKFEFTVTYPTSQPGVNLPR